MFVGEFRHALDPKGRLTIPSSWRLRTEGGGDAYLALPDVGGYITVYGPEMALQLKERIAQVGMSDLAGQRAIAQIMSGAQRFSLDKAGRINLNTRLIEHGGIKKEAVLLGKMASFSIFSAEVYEAQTKADPQTLAAALSRFGL